MVSVPRWVRTARAWVEPHVKADENASQYRAFRLRMVRAWPSLTAKTWAPLFKRAREHGQDLESEESQWGCGGLPAVLLETAYMWAEEWHSQESASKRTRELADEVRKLDADIASLALRLEAVLRRKSDIAEYEGIHSDWPDPGISLLALIRETVRRAPAFEARVRGPLEAFVRSGRQTSASTPRLADLLAIVAEGEPGPVWTTHGDDRASLDAPAGGAIEGPSASVRRFFGQVDDLRMSDRYGRDLRPLDWLTASGIAELLSASIGADAVNGPINEGQIKKLRARYKREVDTDE